MKKLLKALCLLLSLLFVATSLCSCHGSKQRAKFEIPESFDESESYEITFWAKNDTNKNQVKIYQKAIEDFEAIYPNIKVNIRLYTDYSKLYNDVITNIATDTTPNVCITYPDHIATYLTGDNIVVPLNDLLTDEKYGLGGSEVKFTSPSLDEMVPQFLEECKLGEEYYAIPFMRSTEACYINKTYVEALGYEVPDVLTWDFVWEVSDAAMEKNEDGTYKINGQNVMIPFIYKSTDNMMIQMLKQLDAGYSDEDGNIYIFDDGAEQVKGILNTVAEHTKKGAFSTFKISSYPGNFLNAGQCIFAIDSTAGSTWMGTDAPLCDIAEDKIVEFETVVRAIPQYDTENTAMISQGPSVCIFNKENSGEVLASWLFAQYLLTDEVQINYSETEGYVPVTKSAQESEEYLEYLSLSGTDTETHYSIKIDAVKLLLENIDNTFVTPVFNGSASLRDAAGQLIESVTKSVRRKEEVDDEYMEKLFSDVTSLYRLDSLKSGVSSEKAELGELPSASAILLISLAVVWAGLAVYYVISFVQKKKKNKKR